MSHKIRILLIDNFDSFTYNVWDYLSRSGAEVKVKRRNEVSVSEIFHYQGVVISPGPGNPKEIPELMNLVESAVTQKPTLGICLGFQAIAYHFGAEVQKGKPMHGKVSDVVVTHRGNLLKALPDTFQVVRYHSLIVTELKEPLIPLAVTDAKELMAFEHQNLPVAAVQFHPEAHLTQFGETIFRNWLDLC